MGYRETPKPLGSKPAPSSSPYASPTPKHQGKEVLMAWKPQMGGASGWHGRKKEKGQDNMGVELDDDRTPGHRKM
jgi:hypothetical protein